MTTDQGTDDSDEQSGKYAEYEVVSDAFNPPEDHDDLGGDVYLGPYQPEMEQWETADLIEIRDRDAGTDGDDRTLKAPPELTQNDAGEIAWLAPKFQQAVGWEVERVRLHRWRCQRCGSETESSANGVYVGDEIEAPNECKGCDREGPFKLSRVPDRCDPDALLDRTTTAPIWSPPPGVQQADPSDVWDEVRDHIKTHWAAGDGREWLYDGLTALALSTWFRPNFDFVPHLLILGKHETGKTRLLNTLKDVCYRAVHTASASPSSIYRAIDGHNVTLFMSEYHDLEDDTQKITDAVLKAGQKRGEVVLRSEEMGNGFDVAAFQPFTHVAISTQFEPRDDIISRCFRITTRPANRSIPRTIAPTGELREKLLYLRFRYLNSSEFQEAEQAAESHMDENDILNRLSEKLWCLLTMAELCDRDLSEFVKQTVERAQEDQAESEEASFIRALIDEAFDWIASPDADPGEDWQHVSISVKDLTSRFNNLTDRDVSASYVGAIRKRLELEKQRRRDGVHVQDDQLRQKLKTLAEENNVEWAPTEGAVPDEPPESSGDDEDASMGDLVDCIMAVIRRERSDNDTLPTEAALIDEVAQRTGEARANVEYRVERLKQQGELYEAERTDGGADARIDVND